MKSIVLFGDKRDRHMGSVLLKLLQKQFTVHYWNDEQAFTRGHGKNLYMFESDGIRSLELENCILLLKQNSRSHLLKQVHPTTEVIIDASNLRGLRGISHLQNIYTCGFSRKDCLTFSSRGEGNLVASLQRSLRLSDETACEPFEIPCDISGDYSDYAVLASVLALILVGGLNENRIKELGKLNFSL